MKKIMHPGYHKLYPLSTVLGDLASQENCDGEPYDQMIEAAEELDRFQKALEALFLPVGETTCPIMEWLEEEIDNLTCSDVCDKTFEQQGCPSGTCALEAGRSRLRAACKLGRDIVDPEGE